MIGITVKTIIIKKQLKFVFKVPGVLFCTTFSMRTGWFPDVPPVYYLLSTWFSFGNVNADEFTSVQQNEMLSTKNSIAFSLGNSFSIELSG
jgi:hypothetical protein